MTVSTDQADPTGVKSWNRLAFCSSQQPVANRVSSTDPTMTKGDLQERLSPLLSALEGLAAEVNGDPEALLEILRSLEALHRTIQEGPFRSSLPEDRNKLFGFLQTLERSGGWPYIPRLQLKTFIALLDQDSASIAA
jgi:hypothetical protein